jgi:hypothetical protein
MKLVDISGTKGEYFKDKMKSVEDETDDLLPDSHNIQNCAIST